LKIVTVRKVFFHRCTKEEVRETRVRFDKIRLGRIDAHRGRGEGGGGPLMYPL
jgi:hypothetical protein